MAPAGNKDADLVDQFKEATETLIRMITKHDHIETNKAELAFETKIATDRFLAQVRQLDVFFIQKCFRATTLYPGMLLKLDSVFLLREIKRKDMLLTKHDRCLQKWKALLTDKYRL